MFLTKNCPICEHKYWDYLHEITSSVIIISQTELPWNMITMHLIFNLAEYYTMFYSSLIY